jgi:predicted RNA-binding protein
MMCEFKVFLDGEKIAEDIIYVKIEGDQITLRDIIGRNTILKSTQLNELNVMTTRLLMSKIN